MGLEVTIRVVELTATIHIDTRVGFVSVGQAVPLQMVSEPTLFWRLECPIPSLQSRKIIRSHDISAKIDALLVTHPAIPSYLLDASQTAGFAAARMERA